MKKPVIFLCLIFSLFLAEGKAAFSHQSPSDHESSFYWYEWNQEAFKRAQAEDKLILLDLTAVWCHACHVMDQTTYADPQVLALLEKNFIAIRVDTDQRPDLEARYRIGGWPTTSILMPTGEILFQANSLEPEVMIQLLQEIKALYDSEKEDLQQQATQLQEEMRRRPQPNQLQQGALRPAMVSHSVAMMKKEFDPENGGFRDHPKFFEPEAIQMALSYGFFENDRELINMALTTLEKQIALLDSVWGGFYRYAENADWSQPHFEKVLTLQAQNLYSYVKAYQFTGNAEFKYTAWRIIDFVERFLTDPETGQFFESQDADVRDQNGKTLVSGSEYFSWGMINRKANGLPFIDRRIYTGSNADMAWAYLHAAEVLGKPALREKAIQLLKRMVHERFDPAKGVAHSIGKGSPELYGIFSDHIRLGWALVEAVRLTEDRSLLQQTESLATATQHIFEDTEGGGFFDRPTSFDGLGLLNVPAKPPRENIQAARFYLNLFHLTGKHTYRVTAERTLQSVVGTPQPLPVALTGLAADEWFRGPIHIAVVGMPDDMKTQALLKQAHQLYCPRKMIKMFDPQQGQMIWGETSFSYHGQASAFICTDKMCLPPLYEADKMKEKLYELLVVLREPVL